MKKIIITIIFIAAACSSLCAASLDFSAGAVTGMSPFIGGNLESSFQKDILGADDGILDINRTKSGVSTKRIYPLFGLNAGATLRLTLFERFIFITGFHYSQNVAGGKGKTLDQLENQLDAEYTFMQMDIPVAAGISISIFDDARMNLAGGFCTAIGKYTNSFKSSAVESEATFSGVGFPLFITLEAEYFINDLIGVVTTVSYMRGKTEMKESGGDRAEIQFTGFRWQAGVCFHFRNGSGR